RLSTPSGERGWYDGTSILQRLMNRRGRGPGCSHVRGWVRRVAVRAAALLGAGVFSCLPSSELASFSNGARSSAGDGVSPDGVSEEIVTESAPADPNATGE